jgi:hypothetical protein
MDFQTWNRIQKVLLDITWSLDHNLAQIDDVDKILKKICIQGVLDKKKRA